MQDIHLTYCLQSRPRHEWQFVVNGLRHSVVCFNAWKAIFGLPHRSVQRIVADVHNGRRRVPQPQLRHSPKHSAAFAWLTDFVRSVGEIQPNSTRIHLPSHYTKREIFQLFRQDIRSRESSNDVSAAETTAASRNNFSGDSHLANPSHSSSIMFPEHDIDPAFSDGDISGDDSNDDAVSVDDGDSTISECSFYRLWKLHFSHVLIPKQPTQAKCETCVVFQDLLQTVKTQPELKSKLRLMRDIHIACVMKQRHYYWIKRDLSFRQPTRLVSLIVDGMDQAKTALPRFTPYRKSAPPIIDVHLLAFINHSTKLPSFLVCHEGIRKDSNLTVLALAMALQGIAQPWPAQLFIQADNCWRENKNQTVFAFCAWLVAHNLFKEVRFSFLIKGHTHEDIDQLFVALATYLKTRGCHSMAALLEAIRASNPTMPDNHIHNIDTVHLPHCCLLSCISVLS